MPESKVVRVEITYADGGQHILEGDAAHKLAEQTDGVLTLHQLRGYTVNLPEPTKVVDGQEAQAASTQDDRTAGA
jgi:hypothetical protein